MNDGGIHYERFLDNNSHFPLPKIKSLKVPLFSTKVRNEKSYFF